jgi:hypothetical protein
MLGTKESQEFVLPPSPAVIGSTRIDKEKDAPRKWIASYLSGMDEDDFRKRYFKNISRETPPIQPKLTKKPSNTSTSPSKITREFCRQTTQMTLEVDLGSDNLFEKDNPKDEKACSSKNVEALVVSHTDDVLRRWTKRTEDDCRLWYIKTLMMKKVFSDSPSIKEQKIIIFDWDDTLLCTTFLGKMAGLVDNTISEKDRKILAKTDETAFKLLDKSVRYGDTFIITNAAKGWVEYSSQLLMPMTSNLLETKNIKIISARSDFEKKFPGETKRWKREAFVEISKKYVYSITTNIVCLGDSNIEMEAAKQFEDLFCQQSCIKTVKFEAKPDPVALIKQQIHVTQKFDKIFKTYKSKMIRLEKKRVCPG